LVFSICIPNTICYILISYNILLHNKDELYEYKIIWFPWRFPQPFHAIPIMFKNFQASSCNPKGFFYSYQRTCIWPLLHVCLIWHFQYLLEKGYSISYVIIICFYNNKHSYFNFLMYIYCRHSVYNVGHSPHHQGALSHRYLGCHGRLNTAMCYGNSLYFVDLICCPSID